jgi:HlyD family secretion protein
MLKRIVTWIIVVLCVGGAAAGVWWWLRKPVDTEVKYETDAADRGHLDSRITASGTLSALVTVQVGSQVSGRIESLNADFNSTVKKDQIVAKIDPRSFQTDVAKARANAYAAGGNLARSKAQALNAERQYARLKEMRAAGLSSQSDVDAAESSAAAAKADVEASKGSVEQARASLAQAEISLAYTTIRSPIDGIVISRNVDVGQTVAASMSAPTLFTIAEDLRKMQVDTFVAEADVGKLKPGMDASFTVDAFPGRRFNGKVREIRNAPQTVQNVVTYDAVIDVLNPELELKPGMTANVTIVVAERENALKVANAALRFRPGPAILGSASAAAGAGRSGRPGGSSASGDGSARPAGSGDSGGPPPDRKTVYVLRDGKPQAVRVRIGITDGTDTEIVEGELKEGDVVITSASGGDSATATPSSSRGGSPGGQPGGGMRRMF